MAHSHVFSFQAVLEDHGWALQRDSLSGAQLFLVTTTNESLSLYFPTIFPEEKALTKILLGNISPYHFRLKKALTKWI